MAVGQKTGGRKKGTPNKKTQSLLKLIENQYNDFSPILELIKIYKNKKTPLDLKTTILRDISPYMYPKLKPIDREMLLNNDYEKKITNEMVEEVFEQILQCIDLIIATGKVTATNLYELSSYIRTLFNEEVFNEEIEEDTIDEESSDIL